MNAIADLRAVCSRCGNRTDLDDMIRGMCSNCFGIKSSPSKPLPIIQMSDTHEEIAPAEEPIVESVDTPTPESLFDDDYWLDVIQNIEDRAARDSSKKKPRKNSRYKNPKYAVRLKTQKAIRDGVLKSVKLLPCSCGKQAEEYHHMSYDKPDSYLDVIALCVDCHNAVHLAMGGSTLFFGKVRKAHDPLI